MHKSDLLTCSRFPRTLVFTKSSRSFAHASGSVIHNLRATRDSAGLCRQACAFVKMFTTFGIEGSLLSAWYHDESFTTFELSAETCLSLRPEPCRQTRRCFWSWEQPSGDFPKVQSPTYLYIFSQVVGVMSIPDEFFRKLGCIALISKSPQSSSSRCSRP